MKIKFFSRARDAALIAALAVICLNAHAQAGTNILGTCADNFANGPAMSAELTALPNHFVRIQASWAELNPAPGVFVWNTNSCSDAEISNAVAQGRSILFDVCDFPGWVQDNFASRYFYLGEYITAVLQHWPQIAILGCWNEVSGVQNSPDTILPGVTNATSAQIMAEYHVLVTAIYNAKQGVNPQVKLDGGKFVNFASYQANFQLLKSLGTWAMLDYITWHDYDNARFDPMTDVATNGVIVYSAFHKVQLARALFPGKLVGADEFANCDVKSTVQSAAAYRAAGASMLIDCLLPLPTPVNPDPGYLNQWGANPDFTLTERSQLFLELLTMPAIPFNGIWQALSAP